MDPLSVQTEFLGTDGCIWISFINKICEEDIASHQSGMSKAAEEHQQPQIRRGMPHGLCVAYEDIFRLSVVTSKRSFAVTTQAECYSNSEINECQGKRDLFVSQRR